MNEFTLTISNNENSIFKIIKMSLQAAAGSAAISPKTLHAENISLEIIDRVLYVNWLTWIIHKKCRCFIRNFT